MRSSGRSGGRSSVTSRPSPRVGLEGRSLHIDHLRALLELGQREGLADRTWYAFTDGRDDVSPHAAVDDIATASCRPRRNRRRALLRDGSRQALGAHDRALAAIIAGEAGAADDPAAAVRASYGRGVTDEFVEPVVLRGRPRSTRGRTRRSCSTSPRASSSQLTQQLLEAGADVVTMTRYRDDFPLSVAFGEQDVPDTLAQLLSAAGLGQLHAAETEIRPRYVLLQRRGGGTVGGARSGSWFRPRATSRAGSVVARSPRASAPSSATGTASASSTSQTRTWSATRA